MAPLTRRKTYKYTLQPTAEQEATLAFVVRRCRELYNAALPGAAGRLADVRRAPHRCWPERSIAGDQGGAA